MKQCKAKHRLEYGFPTAEISRVAEQESWRKELNRPLTHIHKWWATRLGSVFRAIILAALTEGDSDVWDEFYKTHSLKDKVVLDPFMGSGTTLCETLKLGAKAVGCDVNPVSTFLVRQSLTQVSEADLRREFARLEARVARVIRSFYRTIDPLTNEEIPVLYYFWCKIVECPDGEIVPLLSRFVFAQNAYPSRHPQAQILCPQCWQIIQDRYDATETTCKLCSFHFNPQAGPARGQFVTDSSGGRHRIKDLLKGKSAPPTHRLYASLAVRPDKKKIYLPITQYDLALYASAEAMLRQEDLPLPESDVRPGHNTDQARGYNYLRWRDFFNARQLLCLGLLLQEIVKIEDIRVQEQLLCLFSSSLEFNNLFCSFKGEGTGAVRHMFSNHILKPERAPLENSVWGSGKASGTFCSLFESRLLRAKRYLDDPFELRVKSTGEGKKVGVKVTASNPLTPILVENWEEFSKNGSRVLVLNGDSSSLPIPALSVDAVVTDPPYFDFIHYSELSDFFYAWLSPALRGRYSWMSRKDSSQPGEVQHKVPSVFGSQLAKVFRECFRVLKDDGVMAFSFHHSRPEGWLAICQAIVDSEFVVVAAHHVHAELRGSSPKSATQNPISIDAILVCKKKCTQAHQSENFSLEELSRKAENDLRIGGVKLSSADLFVISASLLLIPLSRQTAGECVAPNLLEEAYRRSQLSQVENSPPHPRSSFGQLNLF